MSREETAVTPSSALKPDKPPGSGVVASSQADPFQCTARVWCPVPLKYSPTAQTSHADSTATLLRTFSLSGPPGFGGWAPVQPAQLAAAAPGGETDGQSRRRNQRNSDGPGYSGRG